MLNQLVWNFCMEKGGKLYFIFPIDHPTTKQSHLKNSQKIFNKNRNSNKNYHITGDFNLNFLRHDKNKIKKKSKIFYNIRYQNGIIPTINKPTRVTKRIATPINRIITNCFTENTFKAAIIRSDVSDHFLICIFFLQQNSLQKIKLSINIKESLMMKQLKLFFKISIKISGMQLKLIRKKIKLPIISY